jgi:glycosyltransferase involved in cell wall biosynthesis
VCEFEREIAEQFRVCPARLLEVVHNGIGEAPHSRLRAVDAQPPVIVMVARFVPQKDHSTLLQALSGLLCLEWRLVLVGAGELKLRVDAEVHALGLGERVRILPPETDVVRLLMGAQIFVLATHYEALPISILEAMRASLPVVATKVGGVSESVRHGETGLLANHKDVAGLRGALAQVIADPKLRVAFGNAGRQRWQTHFTAQVMTARTLEVYRRAVTTGERSSL